MHLLFVLCGLLSIGAAQAITCRAYGYDGVCELEADCQAKRPSENAPAPQRYASKKIEGKRVVTGCEQAGAKNCCIVLDEDEVIGEPVFSIAAVGDSVFGMDALKPPANQPVLSEQIRGIMSDADATFINLETACCEESVNVQKKACSGNCYAFRMPVDRLDELDAAGVDLVSMANNHALDFGTTCRDNLESLLDQRQVAWSGRPGTIGHYETENGHKVALVAFHTAGSSNHLLQPLATSAALVKQAGEVADFVVVSFHGGAEGSAYRHVPDENESFYGDRGHLRAFAHAMIDAGAAIVLGHGPHVLRGLELYRGHLIAYSLGNFATYGTFNLNGVNGLGAILKAHLDSNGRLHHADVVETRQDRTSTGVDGPYVVQSGPFDELQTLTAADFPVKPLTFVSDASNTPKQVWNPKAPGAPEPTMVALRDGSNEEVLEIDATRTSVSLLAAAATLIVAVLA